MSDALWSGLSGCYATVWSRWMSQSLSIGDRPLAAVIKLETLLGAFLRKGLGLRLSVLDVTAWELCNDLNLNGRDRLVDFSSVNGTTVH